MAQEVAIDDTKKPETPEPDLKDKGKVPETPAEPKYVTAEQLAQTVEQIVKKATAPIYYEMRNRKEPQSPVQPQPLAKEPTEWDKKLQENWVGTVEELAERKLDAVLKKREAEAQIQAEKARNLKLLEDNKRTVMEKHKELDDESSVKNQTYRQILAEHPEYLSSPFGPVLAMNDMEKKLRDMGVVDESTKQVVDKEVARQVRTGAGAMPKGTGTNGTSGKVVLTKEQKEYCDLKGIEYKKYAMYVKSSEGVSA